MKKRKIIFKLQKGQKNVPKCDILDLHLAGGQGKWAMCPLKKKVPLQIESSMQLSEELSAVPLKKVPDTIDKVETLFKAFIKGMKQKAPRRRRKHKVQIRKRKKPVYVKLWFFRGRVARMLHLAHRRLQLKKATVAKLAELFPDTGGWLQKFCKVLGLNPQKTQAGLDISTPVPIK